MQPSLFDAVAEERRTIQARFEQFHREHPEVYRLICEFARKAKKADRERYGISALWEVIRWHVGLEGGDTEPYKCNNNFRSRYARLIMAQEPDLAGFFELRSLRAE